MERELYDEEEVEKKRRHVVKEKRSKKTEKVEVVD